MEQRRVALVFSLQGASTNESRMAATGSMTRWWDITSVARGRLVVETYEVHNGFPARISRRREFFLDQIGQLVVETYESPGGSPSGAVPPVYRTIYRKRT